MEILFVRHGQSTQNLAYEKNEEYDPINVSLTQLGKEQAKITGKFLKIYGEYDVIFSSPLLRAIETSHIIKKELKYKKNLLHDSQIWFYPSIFSQLTKYNIIRIIFFKKTSKLNISIFFIYLCKSQIRFFFM